MNEKIAIEVKVAGIYGMDYIKSLRKYRKIAEQKGWNYLYISGQENYEPYYEETKKVIGHRNSFFLDRQNGEWNRFIDRIAQEIK